MAFANKTKVRTGLLLTTVMATLMILPEAGHGAEAAQLAAIRARQEAAARQAQQAEVGKQDTYREAIDNPNHALTNGEPLAEALDSIAGHPQSIAQRYDALKNIEVGANDDHKRQIRRALGISDANLVATQTEVQHFIDAAAHGDIVHALHPPHILRLENALRDPLGELANGQILDGILRNASADNASAARGLIPVGGAVQQYGEKIAALRAVEDSNAPADDAHKLAIRNQLGLNPDLNTPLAHKVTENVELFIKMASDEYFLFALRNAQAVIDGLDGAVFTPASGNGNSGANGQRHGTTAQRRNMIIRIFRGGHADDEGYQKMILTAMGLDNTLPMSPEVIALKDAFLLAARQ